MRLSALQDGAMSTDSKSPHTSSARPLTGLDFDATRPAGAVVPRDAATVLLLREAAPEVEVYCVQRSLKSGFMGGAVVFPGGKVDAQDGACDFVDAAAPEEGTSWSNGDASLARAIRVAACRETLEEAGILLHVGADPAIARAVRDAVSGGASFLDALKNNGARLALDRLVPFARWVTPSAEQRRFDARFFLIAMPEGQEARPCETETIQGFWASPQQILARFTRGEIQLAPPTTRCLELMAPVSAGGIAAVMASAAAQTLEPICPTFIAGDPPFLALPGDPAHELSDRRVEGPTRFVLRDGRFVSAPA